MSKEERTIKLGNYRNIIGNTKETIEEAINYALNNYPNLDVYILGKGDETYIEEKGVEIEFSDKECVLNYIKNHTI